MKTIKIKCTTQEMPFNRDITNLWKKRYICGNVYIMKISGKQGITQCYSVSGLFENELNRVSKKTFNESMTESKKQWFKNNFTYVS